MSIVVVDLRVSDGTKTTLDLAALVHLASHLIDARADITGSFVLGERGAANLKRPASLHHGQQVVVFDRGGKSLSS